MRRVRFDEGHDEIRSYVVPEPVKHKKSWKLKGLKVLSTNAGGGVRVEEREVGALRKHADGSVDWGDGKDLKTRPARTYQNLLDMATAGDCARGGKSGDIRRTERARGSRAAVGAGGDTGDSCASRR